VILISGMNVQVLRKVYNMPVVDGNFVRTVDIKATSFAYLSSLV
jgi:hypothetical protein